MTQVQNKVLIIDDEVDLSLLLKSYLSKKGYDADIKHSIDEGLVALKKSEPFILFLDNNLPDGNGWELGPQLADAYPEMFIFFISAFHPSRPEMPGNSKFVVIEKPVSIAEMDKIFEEHLGSNTPV